MSWLLLLFVIIYFFIGLFKGHWDRPYWKVSATVMTMLAVALLYIYFIVSQY